jgi:excisionase family DNA binding protein
MKRASSTQRPALEVFTRPGGGLGEPGPSGSPTSAAETRDLVVRTLHQLIDTLAQLSNAGQLVQASPSSDLPLLVDPGEVAKLLSLSRPKVCDMVSRGEIPSVRIGRSLRIPRDPLLEWIDHRIRPVSSPAVLRLPTWAHGDRTAEL